MKHTMAETVVVPGTVFERDGRKRELVRLVPANRFASAAIEWRRPSQVMRSSVCSVSAWEKWVSLANQVL